MSKVIEVSDSTYEMIKDKLLECKNTVLHTYDDMIGKKYYFRTVTYHQVGRVVGIVGDFIELEDASWIGDSGRWMQAIKDGELKEVEPTGTFFVNLTTVVDFVPWVHELPTVQK